MTDHASLLIRLSMPWLSESLIMLSVGVGDNCIRKFIGPEILISFLFRIYIVL